MAIYKLPVKILTLPFDPATSVLQMSFISGIYPCFHCRETLATCLML